MSRTVDIPTFAARRADGAVVIDVREPMEYVQGHVPGARLVPMSRISQALSILPRGEDVYVICESGNRSESMSEFLSTMGIDAISVSGGLSAWRAAGHPVVRGSAAA
jgi:rhodanese-related sulfurtransferase